MQDIDPTLPDATWGNLARRFRAPGPSRGQILLEVRLARPAPVRIPAGDVLAAEPAREASLPLAAKRNASRIHQRQSARQPLECEDPP